MTAEEGVYTIGDGRTGPSTIVRCIAEGRKVADAIVASVDPSWLYQETVPEWPARERREEIRVKRGQVSLPAKAPYDRSDPLSFGKKERTRCLECDYICDKCVDVCPNRANIVIPVERRTALQ